MKTITAKIKQGKENDLWLLINADEDASLNSGYPITKEEVYPIMKACQEWLAKNDA